MKILKTLWVFMLLCASSSYAGEYSTREVVPFVADTVKASFPIDVTKESSTVECCNPSLFYAYRQTFAHLGERIGGISFHGYNPGKELKRHLRVWITELDVRWVSEQDQDKWVCVYDGDCTIPSGGSSAEHISLIDIDFDKPYILKMSICFFLKIECSGEIGEEPLYFEYDSGRKSPVARYAVMSDVKYLSGTVTDQDGRPIGDACVQLEFRDNVAAEGKTDTEGKYQLTIKESNHGYKVSVSAEGYPTYRKKYGPFITEADTGSIIERDYVLCNKVCYKKDQRATIILPVAPSPAWGRYYRLVRRERSNIFFERVETPEANVPYVIFPNMDFELSTANYDLQQEPGITQAPHPEETDAYLEQRLKIMQWATLYGSYQNVDLMAEYEDERLLMLDTTPDCEVSGFFGRVGACRAYMAVLGSGINPINLIFPDEPTDVSGIKVTPASPRVYDLQGRRIDGTPEKGLYIRDGRKFIAR
jgi:hypothetical protein